MKAKSSIISRAFGHVNSSRLVQPAKAPTPMAVTESGSLILDKSSKSSKQLSPTLSFSNYVPERSMLFRCEKLSARYLKSFPSMMPPLTESVETIDLSRTPAFDSNASISLSRLDA